MKLLLNTAGEPTQESLDLRRELAEVVSEVKAQWPPPSEWLRPGLEATPPPSRHRGDRAMLPFVENSRGTSRNSCSVNNNAASRAQKRR